MATVLYSRQSNVPHSPQSKRRRDEDSPATVSQFKDAPNDTRFWLKKPAHAKLKKTGVEGTVYNNYRDDVNDWGKFYLPKTGTMEVVGVVEGISCLCEQLVLTTCDGKEVYAYDEEKLHLVASSMEQLLKEGIEYPASKTYYKGDAFKHMTKEDWEKVWKSPVGRRLEEEHKKRVAARKPRLLDYMKHNQYLKKK